MRYGLAPYIGSGTADDPYRPIGGATGAIDLRPDPSVRDGWALVADAPSMAVADSPDERIPAAIRRRLSNALGVTLDDRPFGRIVADLLIDHSNSDGTRWRPLNPQRHCWQIHLGGECMWELPVVAGGALHSESFSGGGANMGSDLTWTESEGGLKRVSDDLRVETFGTAGRGRAEHDADTNDTQTSIDIVTWKATTITRDAMVFNRMTSSSLTDGYGMRRIEFNDGFGNRIQLQKVVSGTFTTLAGPTAVATVLAPNERIRVRSEGSSIKGYLGRTTGSETHTNPTLYFTVTDTSIATGRRGGVRMRISSGPDDDLVECDNFFHADILTGWRVGSVTL